MEEIYPCRWEGGQESGELEVLCSDGVFFPTLGDRWWGVESSHNATPVVKNSLRTFIVDKLIF